MKFTDVIATAAAEAGVSKTDAAEVLTVAFREIVDSLDFGEATRIPSFGTFAVAARPAHEGRNQRTGEAIQAPAKRVAKFRPAAALNERLNPERLVPRLVEPTKRAARGR